MKLYFGIVFMLFYVLAPAQQKMNSKEVADFKGKVEGAAREIRSMQTDFVQQKHMSFLSKDIQSTGKMYLVDDGRLKWQYLEPNPYSLIFSGGKIHINDDGKKSTIDGNQKLFEQISKLISGSVKGDVFNEEEFKIDFFRDKEGVLVKLLPKSKTMLKYIKEVNLTFPNNEKTVSEVKLIEPSDNYTLLKFRKKIINEKIDESIFTH